MIIFTLSEDVAKFGTKSKRSLSQFKIHVLLFSANKQIQPIEKINLVYKSEKDSVIYFNYNIDCTVSAVIYILHWRITIYGGEVGSSPMLTMMRRSRSFCHHRELIRVWMKENISQGFIAKKKPHTQKIKILKS